MNSTAPTNETCAAAISFAQRGFAVLPLNAPNPMFGCSCERGSCDKPGKHPLTRHGLDDASKDEAKIRSWWARYPWANLGVRTGAISGLVVLDLDVRHGGDDSLGELQRKHGPLPQTVEVLTGSGGRHFYFRHPGGVVQNQIGTLGSGLDVKADGGYVIAPPSRHASGRRYEWELSGHPDEVQLAEVPNWILAPSRAASREKGRSAAEWRALVATGAVEGERNSRVASLIGHLLSRGIDPLVALDMVLCWNSTRCRPPLPEEEVIQTANSIARRERLRSTGGLRRG